MHVYLADIDEAMLPEAQEEIAALATPHGGSATAVVTDVSDPESCEALRATVLGSHRTCHLLHCNAGMEVPGGVDEPLDSWHKTLGVNLLGVIQAAKAFLPAMESAAEPGIIICTGSKQGITMPPGNLAYNVSKAGVKAFAEGLQHYLRSTPSASHLTAHLCVPGFVNSMIRVKSDREAAATAAYDEAVAAGGSEAVGAAAAEKARAEFDIEAGERAPDEKPDGAWTPDQTAEFLLERVTAGDFYVICPDNEVDRATDNLRMTWTMQDITENRPPLSRWHDDWSPRFDEFLAAALATADADARL